MKNLADLKNSLERNQKLVIYAAIGVCVLIADFYFVLKPVAAGLIKVLPEVSEKSSRVSIMDVDVRNMPSYEGQIKALETKLFGYKRRFSTKEEISPLLQNLSDTAKACGVKILSINPAKTLKEQDAKVKVASAYRKLPIYLNAASGYHAFGLFLNNLENSDTFMRIADLKITGDGSELSNHKFSVTIVTYIFATQEGAPEEKINAEAKTKEQIKLPEYEGSNTRDPFVSLVTKDGRVAVGYGVIKSVDDIKLEGIVYDPGRDSIAIINGLVLKENDTFSNLKLIKIEADKVTILFNQKQYVVRLNPEE